VEHGHVVVAEYCDQAMSGRTDGRPQFQAMVANAGESDLVVVYMMDRFSRDVYDAPIYKKRLRDKGVRVVSATEAMPDGPEAILIESIYEAMAAMESAHTSRRTKRGMEGNALKCHHNGVPVYGYDLGLDGQYVVNDVQAAVVREVYARTIAGEPSRSIARDLARRGVRTTRGTPATPFFVKNITSNEKYVGVYIFGETRIEGGMPQIVTREDYDMAQQSRPIKVRASEDWGSYTLARKLICGGCGRGMVGVSGRGRRGVKYEYYRCAKRCGAKPVRADQLDRAVVGAIRDLLADRDEALRVAELVETYASKDEAKDAAKAARKRKADAERGIANVLDAVAQGVDPAIAKIKLDELRAEVESAEGEILAQERAESFSREDFADFLQTAATLTDARLLDAFVWQAIVRDEDVIVTLNYDNKKCEPVRLTVPLIRKDEVWLPSMPTGRNIEYGMVGGCLAFRVPRDSLPRAA
jgi:DNA invertase Pin-like site-specific DNA recombinase